MKVKEFAQQAIKNGYNNNGCNGWDWIKDNLKELDHIFQTKEYKKQDCMKYKCMPLLVGDVELSFIEDQAIGTAWYLNNQRSREVEKETYKQKMLAAGWLELTADIVKKSFGTKKKLLVNASMSCDWLTSKIDETYKPFISSDGDCFLMRPKARSRGLSINRLRSAFCKIV